MPNDMSPIAKPAANPLVLVGDVQYDVIEGPPTTSELVAHARADVLQNIDLTRMLSDIDRTNELLYVASCGVSGYGKDLSARIAGLQYKLLTACTNALSAMVTFKESAASVLVVLKRAFRELYNLREDRSVVILARCEQYARSMADTAGTLSGAFKELADEAEAALEATLSARDTQEQDRVAAEKRKTELAAQDAKTRTLREQLATQLVNVQRLYNEAKESQRRAEDRSFTLAIVSSITGAIGSGVAAFAGASPGGAIAGLTGALSGAMKPASPATGSADTTTMMTPASVPAASETIAAPPDTAAEDPNATDAQAPAGKGQEGKGQAGKGQAGKDQAGASKSERAKAAASVIAEGSKELSQRTERMANAADASSNAYAAEKAKYLDMMMDLQKQERDALAAIAEYAQLMKNADTDAVMARAAVQSLQQAVAALKQIVTILENAKLFWEMMARACKSLANDELRETIQLYMKDPAEDRRAEWDDSDFKATLLGLAARWLALGLIASDYQTEVGKIRSNVQETINKAPTIEEARKLAPKLGEKLALDVERDLQALDQANAKMQAEKKQLTVQA